jgi:surface polysaccharide O-acyltransferase-like enzyme
MRSSQAVARACSIALPPTDRLIATHEAHARNAGLDALRAATTLLVVFHHTAITYGAIGGWFYKETPTDRSLASMLLVFFCTLNQAWFMGLFFLLAGYYTPAAVRAKGAVRYLRERLLRLGLPLLFFGYVLGPITIALAQTARGRPFVDTLLALWRQGEFEKGPLWFAWALLIFAVLAVGFIAVMGGRGPAEQPPREFPGNGVLWLTALATGVVAFGLRLRSPVGREVWGLQLGYLASYAVLFTAGCIAATPRWLEHLPADRVTTWRRTAWISLPLLPIIALLGGPLLGLQGRPEGGWSVPAAVYAFWEPLVAWGVILALLQRFQRHFKNLGPVWQKLSRRAFAVYVIHPPVVVAVTLAWRSVPAPALVKFAVSGAVACTLCFVMAGGLLRLPGVRRVR